MIDQSHKDAFSNIFKDRLPTWMNTGYQHLVPYILKLAKFDNDINSKFYHLGILILIVNYELPLICIYRS
jgi:hypothetical protein